MRSCTGLLLLLLLSCSGCFTKALVRSAVTKQYVVQKADSMLDAYVQNGQLIINFVQQVPNTKTTEWHMAIAIDTLLQLHKANQSNHTILSKEVNKAYKALSLYTVLDNTQEFKDFGNGVVAELHYSVMEKYRVPRPDSLQPAKVYLLRNHTHFVYSPFNPPPPDRSTYDNNNNDDEPAAQQRQNMVFLYYPDKKIPGMPLSFIGFSIELRKRNHWERLFFLPFSVLADIITAPIQVFVNRHT